uniref:Genome polyprotein n=1 Tax=Rousettus bat picornavirus TaxID=3141905 RepID=A0AAU7E2L1_9VIRU
MSSIVSDLINKVENTLLQNPKTEEAESNSDRVSASTTINAGSIVQAAVAPGAPSKPDMSAIDTFTSMAYSKDTGSENMRKMVKLKTGQWNTTTGLGTSFLNVELPKAFWDTNKKPAWGPSRYFKFMRGSFHFQIQVNGQQGVCGGLLAVYIPKTLVEKHTTGKMALSTYLNLPHVIMNAATMTQAELFIPYTNSSNYAEIRSSDLGRVAIICWSPLVVSSGSSSTLDVVVYGSFVDLSLQGPIPFTQDNAVDPPEIKPTKSSRFKWVRQKFDIAEGPGSMNLANATCTAGGQSIALAGERAFYDKRTGGSKSRISNLMSVLRIPSVITGENIPNLFDDHSKFNWAGTHAPGHIVYQANFGVRNLGNIGYASHFFQFWRGSIIIRLQVFASQFHKGRIKMVVSPCSTQNFNDDESNNLIYEVCDIGLNSTFDIKIPYTSQNWLTRVDAGTFFRLQFIVNSRLTYNNACPSSVNCVVYSYAGKDFEFACPTTDGISWEMKSWGSEMDLFDPMEEPSHIQAQLESKSVEYGQSEATAAEVGLASAENDGTQDDQVRSNDPAFLNFEELKYNIFAVSHMNLDLIFARAWYQTGWDFTTGSTNWIDLTVPSSSHGALMKFFSYFAGEVNIHIANVSTHAVQIGHVYDPINESGDITSRGTVLVPPGEMMTITAPYYSMTPLREVTGSTFGKLFINAITGSGRVQVYLSLRAPNFLFTRPVPVKKTTASALASITSEPDIEHVANVIDAFKKNQDYPTPMNRNASRFGTAIDKLEAAAKSGMSNADLLMLAGDIETNPGPVSLVYRDRGLYRHYGVKVGDNIIHLNTENPLEAVVNGVATVIKVKDDGFWTTEYVENFDYFISQLAESEVGSKHKFSANFNCEDFAKELFGDKSYTQGRALFVFGMLLILASSSAMLFGSVDKPNMELVFNQDGTDQNLESIVSRAMNWFSSTFMQSFENDIVSFVCKGIVRLTCYLILYCHSPNLLTTFALGTLIFMDLKATSIFSAESEALLKCLVEGDIHGLVSGIVERMQGVGSTKDERVEASMDTIKVTKDMFKDESFFSESLDGFNKFSSAARHFEWWVKFFQRLLETIKSVFKPNDCQKFVTWCENNQDLLCDFLETCNRHLKDCRDQEKLRDPDFHVFHKWIHNKLLQFNTICTKFSISNPISAQVAKMLYAISNVALLHPASSGPERVEPCGVCIMGDPGQGKSFLTSILIKRITKEMGWSRKDVYPHPTGSRHYDGYCGQKIHVIDDMGQNSDEEDIALLCQAMSTIPFTPPMASIEEKGIQYTSQLVIATTNRCDFNTKILTDPEALSRRFKFQFRIRARKELTLNNKLDITKYMSVIKKGEAWEVSKDGYTWLRLDLDELVQNIVQDLKLRIQSFHEWTLFLDEDPGDGYSFEDLAEAYMADFTGGVEMVFDWMENVHTTYKLVSAGHKIKKWFNKVVDNFKEWIVKNRAWVLLFSAISSAAGLIGTIYFFVKKSGKDQEENVYSANLTQVSKKANRFKIGEKTVLHDQAPILPEMIHLTERTAYIQADNTNVIYHVIPFFQTKLLSYGHLKNVLNKLENPRLVFKGKSFDIEDATIQEVSLNGHPMDLIVIDLHGFPLQFKDIRKHFTSRIGRENYLLWSTTSGTLLLPVQNAHLTGNSVTYEGTQCHQTITYEAATKKGMCGGLLVTKIDGAYKIAGLHIAGNGVIGKSSQVGFFKLSDQGVIEDKQPAPFVVHQVSKTKFRESPLHGVWPIEQQPAVLSPHDPRLEKPIESIVKNSALKYRVDHFSPNMDDFLSVKNSLKLAFQKYFGRNKKMTIEQALLEPSEHALDLTTSPGHKYTSQGLRKCDLVKREKSYISELLRADVKKLDDELENSEVYFYAHLKDELRPNQKVKDGNTRCIEASDMDYVVLHRMYFGNLYQKIYEAPANLVGLAVGINPWKDWDSMVSSLFQYNYDFDFSKFDGSLSEALMGHAADVLVSCLEDGPKAKMILEKTILSKHVVKDELWLVRGGMPSGSPCTTVLNSICNLLVSATCALQSGPGSFQCIAYGDDLIVSCDQPMDPELFRDCVAEQFGMEVTPGNKTGEFDVSKPDQVRFLKRQPKKFPGSNYLVGVLDISNIQQHLMWCKNMDDFKTQLDTALLEVVLHGEAIYNKFKQEVEPALEPFKIGIPDYADKLYQMTGYVFE